MKKEYIAISENETAVKIQNTKINAVRMKNVKKNGVRVFDRKKIGISGSIGEQPLEKLEKQAQLNLEASIDYPYELTSDVKDHRNYATHKTKPEELVAISEKILENLRENFSDFDFSETILSSDIKWKMNNTDGLDLEYLDAYIALGIIYKMKSSVNLFDGFLNCQSRNFQLDKFLKTTHEFLNAFRKPVDLPSNRDHCPVFTMGSHEMKVFLNRSLNGENYATGSSLFSSKLGESLFNDKITIEQNRNPEHVPEVFFDMEGIVNKEDRCPLIEKGKLIDVLADKKIASKYRLTLTGSASSSYDDVPSMVSAPLQFQTDTASIKDALKGQPAILMIINAGGDFTFDGNYASPVQLSFLFDGEKLLGKLPEFSITSNLQQMLGKNYIGTFNNTLFYQGDFAHQLQGYFMKIIT